MAALLTTKSTVQCPHGGKVTLTTKNAKVKADGAFALVVGDQGTVAGCTLVIALAPSPCVQVLWTSGAAMATAGTPLVHKDAQGMCLSGVGAPQGLALISNTQSKVAAR